MPTNPMVAQGTLNRARASVVVPNYTTLNITSSNMGMDFLSMEFEDDFGDQIKTGTGVVNSNAPYVIAVTTVNLLRSQALSLLWLQQAESQSNIGRIVVHSDTSAFSARKVHNNMVMKASPGRMNGTDPTVNVVIHGVYYVNNDLWNMG